LGFHGGFGVQAHGFSGLKLEEGVVPFVERTDMVDFMWGTSGQMNFLGLIRKYSATARGVPDIHAFMKNPMLSGNGRPAMRRGFTLVELMVVILIIVVMAVLVVAGTNRFIENSRKVKAMAQFRDFQVGMGLFEGDYQKPPIPQSKRDTGWDTIYGDPGGNYSTQFLVSALAGGGRGDPYKGESFSSKDVNPRNESYMTFPFSPDNKAGVGKDGRLYDPWGGEVMVAINGFKSNNPNSILVDFNSGQNDRRLHTWGLAEYIETKPKDQSYVFWSYGKDKKKGKNGPNNQSVVKLAGSDDVISW
jgi:prepilin-type N-terminal cleavage/methylation domain-containing protein